MKTHHILIDSRDEKGLVYKVSKILFEHDLNMISNSEYVDKENSKFFMRSVVSGSIDEVTLQNELQQLLGTDANVRVTNPTKKNIILMATKESHCLGDILIRYEAGELNANILAVVSNYDDLRSLVEKFDIPYHTVSHEDLNRAEHEAEIVKVLDTYKDIDYIVLAKYMRILTPDFVERYENKILNIHHSFLPAFIGANPYKQAFERGVKIIGATAHYVNNNLDEGPIITQSTIDVDHSYSWKDMQRAGRDVEKIVLSQALKLVLEDRIFVYANKTVIL